MKTLLNKNQSIYTFNLLNKFSLIAFYDLLKDFNYEMDEIQDLVYGKDGMLDLNMTKVYVVVDYGAREILSISEQ